MRKRSKYRPKGVRLDCMGYVKAGFQPVRAAPKNEVISITNYSSLDAICFGKGTKEDVLALIHAVNLAEALVLMDVGTDYKDEIRAGSNAVQELSKRYIQTQKVVFKADEMQSVRRLLEIHEAQLDAITVAEIEKANALVVKEVKSGRAINVYRQATGVA